MLLLQYFLVTSAIRISVYIYFWQCMCVCVWLLKAAIIRTLNANFMVCTYYLHYS